MRRSRVAPGRLRRRLTIAFLAVAAAAAGVLGAGSYALVRRARLDDSLRRAEAQARVDLRLAGEIPRPLQQSDVDNLLSGQELEGVHAILVVRGQAVPSSEAVAPAIPADLRRRAAAGQLGYRRLDVAGRQVLMIGARLPGSRDELYLLYDEEAIAEDLAQLRTVLLVGWLVVVATAGVVGSVLARRTLEPVARASHAARAIAEGLLDTRLPADTKDEFGAWAASFNEMAGALEAKIAALSDAQARERRFTSDVAHELRTPLAALVGAASVLGEHLDRVPADVRQVAGLLIRDVRRLRRLVDDLMEISRFDAGREAARWEPVDLKRLVEAILRARGWEDRVPLAGDPLTVATDRRRVERVVANLVDNALEHGARGQSVSVRDDGRDALVEVSDTGPGIAAEHLPHLFERFYKADPSRTGPGSGLGLAIARENARLVGGDIEVASEPGAGTRFTLRLPGARPVTEPLPRGEGAVASARQDAAGDPSSGAT
jgi:two-component system, OmpR family, sensor histidine kinase MtrB